MSRVYLIHRGVNLIQQRHIQQELLLVTQCYPKHIQSSGNTETAYTTLRASGTSLHSFDVTDKKTRLDGSFLQNLKQYKSNASPVIDSKNKLPEWNSNPIQMIWILQFPPEIIQLIFDGIPLPYLREYLHIDQIGNYAFNSYYANILICDFRQVRNGWCELTKSPELLGETDVFPRTYSSKQVYGSLTYPTSSDFYRPPSQWKAPVVYFMNLEEFLDFSEENDWFSPKCLEFSRPRDFAHFYLENNDKVSKIERIHIYPEVYFSDDHSEMIQEIQDCRNMIEDEEIPNVSHSCMVVDSATLDLQLFPTCLDYLEVIQCQMGQFKFAFANVSVTHLGLSDVRITPEDMEFLPTSVKYLTLTNSLRLDEEEDVLVVKSPPNLIQLVIAKFREDTIVCEVDLLALTKLRYVQMHELHCADLEDLKLPNSIEILKLGAPELESLKGIEMYTNLRSIYFQTSYLMNTNHPLWMPPSKFPPNAGWANHTVLCDGYSCAELVCSSQFPKEQITSVQILTEWDISIRDDLSHLSFFDYPNLTVLDLAGTQIPNVNSWVFPETLIMLNLSRCNILKFTNHNFSSLAGLRRLHMLENNLESLNGVTESLPLSLKELDLLYNKINKFQGSHLSLLSLDLSDNPLHTIVAEENLSLPDSCEILKLESTPIRAFDETFLFPKNLKELSLKARYGIFDGLFSEDVSDEESMFNNASLFVKLPQGMHSLHLDFYGESSESSFDFPTGLRQLAIKNAPSNLVLDKLTFLEELHLQGDVEISIDLFPVSLRKIRMEVDTVTGSLDRLVNLERIMLEAECWDLEETIIVPEPVRYISIPNGAIAERLDYSKCGDLLYLELGDYESLSVELLFHFVSLLKINPYIRIYLGREITGSCYELLDEFRTLGGLIEFCG